MTGPESRIIGGSLGILCLLAAACGTPPPAPTPHPTPAPPLAITVAGIPPDLGATSQLTATAMLADGSARDVSAAAAWASTDPAIVSVGPGGLAIGTGGGTADVSATWDGATGTLRLTLIDGLSAFARDYIESIHLGFGALMPSDGFAACPARGRWTGFPRGAAVRLLISDTVAAPVRAGIVAALDDLDAATRGQLSVSVASTPDPTPLPGLHEVTVTTHPSPASQGCGSDIGCTFPGFNAGAPGVLAWSRIVMPATQTINAYVHDAVGHGLMGLCHIDGAAIGGPGRSLMSGGPGVFSNEIAVRLTDLDVANARFVYASMLDPGASRQAFRDAGLISPFPGLFEPPGRGDPPPGAPIPSLPIRSP